MIERIVSGGQTGVDRAALDVAIKLSIPHGGWCPKGRLSEEPFPIPPQYLLEETESSDVSVRTKQNIRDSDGTLIILPKDPPGVTDGTILTIEEVRATGKPYLIIDLSKGHDNEIILNWIVTNNIKKLNIAGPRESQSPGIHDRSFSVLEDVFKLAILKGIAKTSLAESNKSTTFQQVWNNFITRISSFMPRPRL